ncbi:MAG: hypothetical protein M5U07_19740 [Xanthobacteraceae bacterium]|nr:hypothetical protein [Xanthobacteraceae bacterium]PWB66045.1 MAG: hypothetical protein C3F17_02475 [Bradyrhizobiaceae bacterium]
MSASDAAPLRHLFTVQLAPDPNALARLLAPFVIHDVLPERLESVRAADDLAVRIEFTAPVWVACRLADRLAAMVPVREVTAVAVAEAAAA